MLETALQFAESAGRLLLEHFGRVQEVRVKESQSSIVTQVDLASDRLLRELLRAKFPDHNILSEESGRDERGSPFTWVIDPLDGTSNFAAGIPWFGVLLALLEHANPILGVMVLPAERLVYTAQRGQGALRNGQPVQVTSATDLASVLCAFGLDASTDPHAVRRQAVALSQLVQHVRNTRSTNSLVDFALTIDGRLGACVNYHTKLWDIAAPSLILEEAGGIMTALEGQPLAFSLGPDACQRSYAIVGSNPILHPRIVEIVGAALPAAETDPSLPPLTHQ